MYRSQFSLLVRIVPALAAVLVLSSTAMADTVTGSFAGQVTSLNGWTLPGEVGNTFVGTFTFESAPVQSGFLPNYFSEFTITLGTISNVGGTWTFGLESYTSNPSDAFLDDGAFDIFQISGTPAGIFSSGLVLQGGTAGYDATNFANPLDLGGFSSRTIRLRETSSTDLRGEITVLTRSRRFPNPPPPRCWLSAA